MVFIVVRLSLIVSECSGLNVERATQCVLIASLNDADDGGALVLANVMTADHYP